MALSTKFSSAFWSDDDVARLSSNQKLALIWALTNRDVNNVGFQKVSQRQFEFDCGLPVSTLVEAMKQLPRGLVVEERNCGLYVLWVNYIHYNFGDRDLKDPAVKDPLTKSLLRLVKQLSDSMREALNERYGLPSSYLAPTQPLLVPMEPLKDPMKVTEQRSAAQRTGSEGGDARGGGENGGLRFDLADQILKLLNQATGSQFPQTHHTLYLIASRLQEVHGDFDGVKKMVERQTLAWSGDAKMRPYLRPQTLFDEEKFSAYYGQRNQPAPSSDPRERRRQLEQLMDKNPANRESVYFSENASEADRKQLRAWRQELEQLEEVST